MSSEDAVCPIFHPVVGWLAGSGSLGKGGDWISFLIAHQDDLLSVRTVIIKVPPKCPNAIIFLIDLLNASIFFYYVYTYNQYTGMHSHTFHSILLLLDHCLVGASLTCDFVGQGRKGIPGTT